MDSSTRRVTGSRLIDHDGAVREGDFLLHQDGSFSLSKGDEDVVEVIDGSDLLITRSLQNWHTHLPMTLNRSMGEGMALMDWLQTSIFPSERNLTPELASIGTRASVAEMISGGTTFACDMYHFPSSIAPIVADSGIRGIICGPTTDWPPAEDGEEDSGNAIRELESMIRSGPLGSGRVEIGIATHAVYTCSEEVLRRASEMSRELGARLHIHTSETREEVAQCHERTGMYPIEYLDSIDYFTEGTICAHCGWVTKKEMRILAKNGAHAVHCPVSNQKLACGGTMSYPAMIEAGVDVRLGTDGAASNNGLDMRAEAKAASLVQKHDHWDATILDPVETWKLATKGSSDWVTWDLSDIRMRPRGRNSRRVLSNLVYSGAQCMDVFVDGMAIRRSGETLTLDEKKVSLDLEEAAQDYYSDI
ncbi:MAG: chlorohydrolase [Euryarchaeota archaeon]|nr:chlorohydrolase [Euryarchaeota archaeon]HII33677.1 amidohydrolase family protein [Candidatus Thalassarchaeaceae archaeon]